MLCSLSSAWLAPGQRDDSTKLGTSHGNRTRSPRVVAAFWKVWRGGIGSGRTVLGLESLHVWGHTCQELGAGADRDGGTGTAAQNCIPGLMWMVSFGPGMSSCSHPGWTRKETGSICFPSGFGAEGGKQPVGVRVHVLGGCPTGSGCWRGRSLTSTAQLGDEREMGGIVQAVAAGPEAGGHGMVLGWVFGRV